MANRQRSLVDRRRLAGPNGCVPLLFKQSILPSLSQSPKKRPALRQNCRSASMLVTRQTRRARDHRDRLERIFVCAHPTTVSRVSRLHRRPAGHLSIEPLRVIPGNDVQTRPDAFPAPGFLRVDLSGPQRLLRPDDRARQVIKAVGGVDPEQFPGDTSRRETWRS